MGLKDQIKDKTNLYLSGKYDVSEGYTIPSRQDLTFGKTAKLINCKVMYIDLRNSKKLLSDHGPITAIRIHKCFLYAVTKCVNNRSGKIRSFNGDSILCFFRHNNTDAAKKAVKTAMNIKYVMNSIVNPIVKDKYGFEIDYGIGIGQGEVYVAKSGVPNDESYQDLIWIGWPTYVAHAFGDEAKRPQNIWISEAVYTSIKKDDQYIYSDGKHMWTKDSVKTGGTWRDVYKTSYYWKL